MTWRTTAKTAAARLVCWTGGDTMVRALTGGAAPPLVVGYHRVVDDLEGAGRHAIPAMLTSRAMLEQHLDWIGRRHRFVTLDELGQRIEDGEPVSRLAAVTFDDGYRDLYEHAFPVLARKGIPAAAFVVTDLVGTTGLLIHDRLYVLLRRAFSRWRTPLRDLGALLGALDIWLAPPGLAGLSADARSALQLLLRRLPRWDVARIADALEERVGAEPDAAADMLPLTWEMLAEMQRAGMTIGSHTRTHAWLTRASAAELSDEVEGSRRAIEARLRTPVAHFAYPDGHFDRRTIRAVAGTGYRFAYTTCGHRDPYRPTLTIPRRLLWQNSCLDGRGVFSPEVMRCQVSGVFALAGRCRQDHRA
jgi:peptidoglycan/xylan/chitin deacetylase (PgdA/CDA1 family)